MIYKTYKVLYDFKEKMNEKNISSYAASTAFFLFVSMISPILIHTDTFLKSSLINLCK